MMAMMMSMSSSFPMLTLMPVVSVFPSTTSSSYCIHSSLTPSFSSCCCYSSSRTLFAFPVCVAPMSVFVPVTVAPVSMATMAVGAFYFTITLLSIFIGFPTLFPIQPTLFLVMSVSTVFAVTMTVTVTVAVAVAVVVFMTMF